jgi:protocatechuate 3,4-dioxygenase beta subunit
MLLILAFYSIQASAVCNPTQNDVEGPYYVANTPFRSAIAGPEEPGERIIIKGAVLSSDCKTIVRNALIEVWQTDSSGEYHYKDEGYRLRGQLRSDGNGQYEYSTIKPGRYRIKSGFRPAHIHIKVSKPGYRTVTTQLYFTGDPYLWPNDACGLSCKSNDPDRIIDLSKQKIKEGEVLEGTFSVVLRPYASRP